MNVIRRECAEKPQRLQEREQMQRHLQQVAKLEAVGLFAGGIVHDFSNILDAILGYGDIAYSHLGEGSHARRPLDEVMRAGARGKELVERFLAFSRSGMHERVPVHVESVLEETLQLLTASLPADVRLERQLKAAATVVVVNAIGVRQVADEPVYERGARNGTERRAKGSA
jgi:C4-dicarboxylate-specific signal transduction histidine kinase